MLRILLVDESSPFQDSLSHLLRSRYPDSVIEQVNDFAETEKIISSIKPDIVFISIHLPEGKGLALAKAIKTQQPKITIMAIADYDLPEYHVASRRAGIDYFVPKDQWPGEKLLALVDSLLMKLKEECP